MSLTINYEGDDSGFLLDALDFGHMVGAGYHLEVTTLKDDGVTEVVTEGAVVYYDDETISLWDRASGLVVDVPRNRIIILTIH